METVPSDHSGAFNRLLLSIVASKKTSERAWAFARSVDGERIRRPRKSGRRISEEIDRRELGGVDEVQKLW